MKHFLSDASIVNMIISVFLPIIILYACSSQGEMWYQLGAVPSLVLALTLPILVGLGILLFAHRPRYKICTPLMGIGASILTGLVTIYAQSGDGVVLRASTPWIYAAKEMMVPVLTALIFTCGGTSREDGLFCTVLRKAMLFLGMRAAMSSEMLKAHVETLNCQQEFRSLLRQGYLGLMILLGLLALIKCGLTLYFQIPVLDLPEAEQMEGYNHAIVAITLCSTVVSSLLVVLAAWMGLRFLHRLKRFIHF